jgi:hypothetical protein
MRHRIPVSAMLLAGLIAVNVVPAPAGADILISVDKSTQTMSVAIDGEMRWRWPVSTGKDGYATPTGTFRPFHLSKYHRSREWDYAPMPHSIFFTHRGHAIHGSAETRRLGRTASHGCVRISLENAEKLFELVQKRGRTRTTVVITGDAPSFADDTPAVAQRSRPAHEPDDETMASVRHANAAPYGALASWRAEPEPERHSRYSNPPAPAGLLLPQLSN